MRRCRALWALLVAAGLASGCVERRYVIVSDPPGALVYCNGRPIGNTPVDDSFIYYAKYHFTLVKDGYETLNVEEDFSTPWYEYAGLDFVSENIWPFKVRDVRRPTYQMQPLKQVRHDDVLKRADELRARDKTLVPFNPASVPNRNAQAPAPAATAGPGAAPTAPPATAPAPPATAPAAPAPGTTSRPVASSSSGPQ